MEDRAEQVAESLGLVGLRTEIALLHECRDDLTLADWNELIAPRHATSVPVHWLEHARAPCAAIPDFRSDRTLPRPARWREAYASSGNGTHGCGVSQQIIRQREADTP